jgi:hypothetical protein
LAALFVFSGEKEIFILEKIILKPLGCGASVKVVDK